MTVLPGRAWLLALVAACGAVIKPPPPSRRLAVETQGTLFESSGGYVFAALPDPGSSVVRLDVRYPIGSADDPPGKPGLAHLIEHLLFEREITYDGRKTSVGAELGRIALSWNAETYPDYTNFEVLAPAAALDELVALEAARISDGCTGITPEMVTREREVVLDELRERQGASGAELSRAITAQVYPAGHPYRAVDSVDTVATLALGDVCSFLFDEYRHGKAFVIASGAVDGDALRAAAERHFGRVKARDIAKLPAPDPAPAAPGTVKIRADVDEPMLIATWPLPPSFSREYRLLQLVWPRIAPRLEAFAFTFGWGHTGTSWIIGGDYASVLAVAITLGSPDKADDAVEAMAKSVAFGERELGQERGSRDWADTWQARAGQVLAAWESLGSRNAMLGDMLQYEGEPPPMLPGRLAELNEASPDAVRELAEHWLSPGRARYVILEPSGTPGNGAGVAYTPGGAEALATRVDASHADQPLPAPAPPPALDIESYRLGNGLTVLLWPHGNVPVVHGRLVVRAGSAEDPPGAEGISELVGASEVTPDSLVFERRTLSTRVDELVDSLALELRFPGQEVTDDDRAYLKKLLHAKRAKERADYAHDFAQALYGSGHPYARYGLNEHSIDRIHRDLVMSWARSHIVPKNSTLVISGQFDPELVKRYIAYDLDQVSGGSAAPPVPTPGPIVAPRWVRGEADEASPTVELDVAFPAGQGLDKDFAKRLVAEQLISSRLDELRAKDALSYGFSVDYRPRAAGGKWSISGEVDARRAAEASAALETILAEIRSDPDSNRAAFVLAREKVLESLLQSSSSSSAVADRLARIAALGAPLDIYDELAREVAAMTLHDLQPFLASELALPHQVFGAFGNEAAVNAALHGAHPAP